jgi:hypothetical protein
VLRSPAGEGEGQVSKRLIEKSLAGRFSDLVALIEGRSPLSPLPPKAEIERFGAWLFDAFFAGRVGELWRSSLAAAHDWTTRLSQGGGLRLAVFNACSGSRHGKSSVFSGLAQSLVRSGVPVVVAMQFPISDAAAVTFTRAFYGALAKGENVERAAAGSGSPLSSPGSQSRLLPIA